MEVETEEEVVGGGGEFAELIEVIVAGHMSERFTKMACI